MVTDENGHSTIPSYVSFPNSSPPLVGFAALEEASSNPENTIYNVK
jgi:molecular chaperone DnaK (HSP70)